MKESTNKRDGIPSRFLCKIPRDAYLRRVIFWFFRRYVLNEDYYAVRRKFTGPRGWSTCGYTLKADATAFRYYLDRRPIVSILERRQSDRINARYHAETVKAQEYIRSLQTANVLCNCDNTHEQNDTVCQWCWANGRRNWNDPDVTVKGMSH